MDTLLNFIKHFFELVKTYWGYFMTLLAVTTFIWTMGVKAERKSSEKQSINKDITEIKTTQKEQGTKVDSLLNIITYIKESQVTVIENQNALRNSYVNFVANINDIKKRGLTSKQFLEYMEGIQFSIKKPEPVKDTIKKNFSIKVRKIDMFPDTL